jgi:hypothetical protein
VTRLEKLRKIAEFYGMTVRTEQPWRTSGEEDLAYFFLPEEHEEHKPVERYVLVTGGGEDASYIYTFANGADANARAVEYIYDDIFPEHPVALYDLVSDTAFIPAKFEITWKPWAKENGPLRDEPASS